MWIAAAAGLATAAAAGPQRPALLSSPYAVALHDGDGQQVPSAAEDMPRWRRSLQLAEGRAFECRPTAAATELRAARRRDRLAARWAPLRHRCHAWRRSDRDEGGGDAAQEEPSWVYRVCFGGEATAWSPRPRLERYSLGWYAEALDEAHANGSVTLHYANGTGGRAAAVRCECGAGPAEILAWDVQNAGRQHALTVSLASCCSLRRANGTRMPIEESFEWLASPLKQLPCYTHRHGHWFYRLCPANATLLRVPISAPASNLPFGGPDDDVQGEQAGQGSEEVIESSSGQKVSVSHEEDGSPIDSTLPESNGDNKQLVLGSGVKATRLIPALAHAREPIEASPGLRPSQAADTADGFSGESFHQGPAAGDALTGAIASGSRRHRAVELRLMPGDACHLPGGRSPRRWQASVRWLCPATWRSAPPERDGGHTSLLAAEHPAPCEVVLWVSSLLICSDERLLPAPAAPKRRIACRGRSGAGSAAHVASARLPAVHGRAPDRGRRAPDRGRRARDRGQRAPDRGRRAGAAFRLGQVVEVPADGTRGVVLGWDAAPSPRLLAASGAAEARGSHYLVVAGRGQLPLRGVLPAGLLGLPLRAAYLPQAALRAWRGPHSAEPPVRLPPAALGRFFTGYDQERKQFVPAEGLSARYRTDDAGATESREADLAEELAEKRQELLRKLEALKALQKRLSSLKSFDARDTADGP